MSNNTVPTIVLVVLLGFFVSCYFDTYNNRRHVRVRGVSYWLDSESADNKAAVLSQLHDKLNKVVNHVVFVRDPAFEAEIDHLRERYPHVRFGETKPFVASGKNSGVAYNENKRDVFFCLEEQDGKEVDSDALFRVALHEIAHCMTVDYDPMSAEGQTVHSDRFRECEAFLMQNAQQLGLIQMARLNGKTYCNARV